MFICRSNVNPRLILTTLRPNGSGNQWQPQSLIGPGGYTAKTFATEAAAKRQHSGQVVVERLAV
jgi:hypothetical protein